MDPITITLAGVGIVVVASACMIWRRLRGKKAERPAEAELKIQGSDGLGARFRRKAKKAYHAARRISRRARMRVEALCAAIKAWVSVLLHPECGSVPQISSLCFVGLSHDEFSAREAVVLKLPDTRAP